MQQLVKVLQKLDGAIARLEAAALIVILSTMMLVAFAQVVLRNFFSTALSWGDGLTRALVLWAGFIGASLAVNQGRYINIDVISRLLPPKQRRFVRYLIYIFAITVCFLLGLAAVNFVETEKVAGTEYSIGIQSWLVELVIPIVFFFLSLRFLLKFTLLLSGGELEKQEWER